MSVVRRIFLAAVFGAVLTLAISWPDFRSWLSFEPLISFALGLVLSLVAAAVASRGRTSGTGFLLGLCALVATIAVLAAIWSIATGTWPGEWLSRALLLEQGPGAGGLAALALFSASKPRSA